MRTAEKILKEKLEQGKSLEYVKALATAIEHQELRELVDKKLTEKQAA
jgi:hypothetical protein